MIGDGSFLVEDFINAITAQLDRVQDALRLKAVNRPLTYALKDLALDLHVFVEMDAQGNVKFRTSGPNEAGASTVHLSFTTITKPMIEENTISLAMTRSPLLHEIGFDAEERKRLEQLGVRNAAQLQRLGSTTGTSAIARLAGIPMERLRHAFRQSQPQVTQIRPEPAPPMKPPVPPRTPRDVQPVAPPRRPDHLGVKPVPSVERPGSPRLQPLREVTPSPHVTPQRPGMKADPVQAPTGVRMPLEPPVVQEPISPVIHVTPNTRRLQLFGNNLIGEGGAPLVRLNQQPLNVVEVEDDRLVVELPDELTDGAFEIALPDGQQLTYELSVNAAAQAPAHGPGSNSERSDPWAPSRGTYDAI